MVYFENDVADLADAWVYLANQGINNTEKNLHTALYIEGLGISLFTLFTYDYCRC
jgi:hypothetical protein